MSVRPGIDFRFAGASEYAALVNISDGNVTLHCADDGVPDSSLFTMTPASVAETPTVRAAMVRFAPKAWCVRAQAKRPHKVRVVKAEQGVTIRDKAEGYVKAGQAVVDAVRRAYSEVTGQPVVNSISVHEHREERKRLLSKLKQTRALDLFDDTLYGHITNTQLSALVDDPLLFDEIKDSQRPELPEAPQEMSPDEKERRELFSFLRANGVVVKGFPSLENLKNMHREFEAKRMEEAAAAL